MKEFPKQRSSRKRATVRSTGSGDGRARFGPFGEVVRARDAVSGVAAMVVGAVDR